MYVSAPLFGYPPLPSYIDRIDTLLCQLGRELAWLFFVLTPPMSFRQSLRASLVLWFDWAKQTCLGHRHSAPTHSTRGARLIYAQHVQQHTYKQYNFIALQRGLQLDWQKQARAHITTALDCVMLLSRLRYAAIRIVSCTAANSIGCSQWCAEHPYFSVRQSFWNEYFWDSLAAPSVRSHLPRGNPVSGNILAAGTTYS